MFIGQLVEPQQRFETERAREARKTAGHQRVILQIAAHCRQVLPDIAMPSPASSSGRSDARQEQQLRGIERAARKDHLACHDTFGLAAVLEFDACGGIVAAQDAHHLRPGSDGQVAARHGRREVGRGAAFALALAHGEVGHPEPLLRSAVEIVELGKAHPPRGLNHRRIGHRVAPVGGYVDRAVAAVIGPRAAPACFRATEIGQHVVIGPARQAQLRPAVVVAAVAA